METNILCVTLIDCLPLIKQVSQFLIFGKLPDLHLGLTGLTAQTDHQTNIEEMKSIKLSQKDNYKKQWIKRGVILPKANLHKKQCLRQLSHHGWIHKCFVTFQKKLACTVEQTGG